MLRRGSCKAPSRRRHPSPRLSARQDQALSSSLYLLRETGPTGFLLREEEPEDRDFRVFLGNPHVCNCPTFQKGGELCKHICWILLKKFKLPRNHEYALQSGLVEGEIDDLLRGVDQFQSPRQPASDQCLRAEGDGQTKQKEIGSEDICSICQEVLLEKRLPVTFCRFGCGNNIHIKCMKILASYQDAAPGAPMVKCPLCREDFAPLQLILEEFRNSSKLVTVAEKERLDRHLGIPCSHCRQLPIEGKCYKCAVCVEYHLCQDCFDSRCHRTHPFTFREKRNQRWKSLESKSDGVVKHADIKSDAEEKRPQSQVCTPKPVVRSLPLLMITKNSRLLGPGCQCRLCLQAFCPGQCARLLPCSHKFHRKCIDSWLFRKCNACPVDGQVIYNPLTWKDTAVSGRGRHSVSGTEVAHLSKQEEPALFVPGTGLVLNPDRPGVLPSIRQRNSEQCQTPLRAPDAHPKITIGDLYAISLDDSNSRKLIYECKIRQHFPTYFHDLPTESLGKTSPQIVLPSIAHKNILRPTGTKGPQLNDMGQSQNMFKDSKRINHNLRKILGTKIREETRRPNTFRRFKSYCQLGYN